MSEGPRLLVVTVVHRPDDARILHRQIAYLSDAGFRITYAAPWRATGVTPPDGLATRDLPRASGRERLAALLAARDLLRAEADVHDLVLLHDPELLLAVRLAGVGRLPPVVWDVHEDTAVALGDREWVPAPLRRLLALGGVRILERWAERAVHLVLAEDGYRDRFRRSIRWCATIRGPDRTPTRSSRRLGLGLGPGPGLRLGRGRRGSCTSDASPMAAGSGPSSRSAEHSVAGLAWRSPVRSMTASERCSGRPSPRAAWSGTGSSRTTASGPCCTARRSA